MKSFSVTQQANHLCNKYALGKVQQLIFWKFTFYNLYTVRNRAFSLWSLLSHLGKKFIREYKCEYKRTDYAQPYICVNQSMVMREDGVHMCLLISQWVDSIVCICTYLSQIKLSHIRAHVLTYFTTSWFKYVHISSYLSYLTASWFQYVPIYLLISQ